MLQVILTFVIFFLINVFFFFFFFDVRESGDTSLKYLFFKHFNGTLVGISSFGNIRKRKKSFK